MGVCASAGLAGTGEEVLSFKMADFLLRVARDDTQPWRMGNSIVCCFADPYAGIFWVAQADCVLANSSATSSVSMNSLTLIGLVR